MIRWATQKPDNCTKKNRQFLSGFSEDHWKTRHVWTIQIPDLSDIQMVTVNHSKHSISETQVMEQRIFSFGIKEQLIIMLQNVNDVEQESAPSLQRRLAYV